MHFPLLVAMCVGSSEALNVMFDKFEQSSGFDIAFFDLRVRKINRTTAALNGTVTIKEWATNDIKYSMDLFHSRLGNQQFNHYPMKLPSCGICDFIDHLHANYEEHLVELEKFPAAGECPIAPRVALMKDYVFPSETIPVFAPRGLWKAVMTGVRSGEIVGSYTFVMKASDD